MQFVDTHCHLNLDVFQADLVQVVERAQDAGVNKIVVPGIDVETSRIAVELATKFEIIYAAVGIHPYEAEKSDKQQIKIIEALLKESKVVAVGEIGLDFYHHPESRSQQYILLENMLDLASQFRKPVILHSRNAVPELIIVVTNWIKKQKTHKGLFHGVFHGFEGSLDQSFAIEKMNMTVGIGGPITYKNAIDKQDMVKNLGLQNLVIETDAPFLSPHPFRGKTNEPFQIPLIAKKLSELFEVSIEKVSEITSQNAQSLFRWDEIN